MVKFNTDMVLTEMYCSYINRLSVAVLISMIFVSCIVPTPIDLSGRGPGLDIKKI